MPARGVRDKLEKRTKAISIKMTPNEWEKCEQAALRMWPGARMKNSEIMLSLAMHCVELCGKKRKAGRGRVAAAPVV